jgi:tetratricopeptide (TPR) repeat protein
LVLAARRCSTADAPQRQVSDLAGRRHWAEVVWFSPSAEVDLALWRVADFRDDPPIPLALIDRTCGGDLPATGYGFPAFFQPSHRPVGGPGPAWRPRPTPDGGHRLERLTGRIAPAQGPGAGVPLPPVLFTADANQTVGPKAERPEPARAGAGAEEPGPVKLDWESLVGAPILVGQAGEHHCVGLARDFGLECQSGTLEVAGFDSLARPGADAAGFWDQVAWVRPDTMPVLRGDGRERLIWTRLCPAEAPHHISRRASRELEQALLKHHRATLWGLPGKGQSQIAAALVRRCRAEGWLEVFWVDAGSRDALLWELRLIAQSRRLAHPHQDPESAAASLVGHWNRHPQRRLIVFDNLTDRKHLSDLRLRPAAATVVVTAADQAAVPFPRSAPRIEVGALTEQQAQDYLTAGARLDDQAAPGAARVAERLGRLPLALAQAAGVVRLRRGDDPGYDYAAYLADLDTPPQDRAPVFELGAGYPPDAARAILLAHDTAIEAAADRRRLVADIITALAFLDPAGVHRTHLAALTADGPAGDDDLAWALGLLEGVCLVARRQDGQTVVMHRLVSRVIRHRLSHGSDGATAVDPTPEPIVKVLDVMTAAPTDGYAEQRRTAGELAAHLSWLLRRRPTTDQDRTVLACARALVELNDPFSAIAVLTIAHDNDALLLGLDHLDTLTTCGDLADAHLAAAHMTVGCLATGQLDAGHADQAIALLERNLADYERLLGPDHPKTRAARDKLANAHWSAGNFSQAIVMRQRGLADSERLLGPDHPKTRAARGSLASAHWDAGQTDQAIALLELNLADRERLLGPDHPDTIHYLGIVAAAHQQAGDLDRAIALLERALTARERLSGPDHIQTLVARDNLAAAHQAAGQAGQAIDLLERNLAADERRLGPDHPTTLRVCDRLAFAHWSAGHHDQAIALYQRLLAAHERLSGLDRPDTIRSRHNLAEARRSAGQTDQAIDLLERVLTDSQRVLGPDHPFTILYRSNLAAAHQTAGHLDRAITLLKRNLTDNERILGSNHPDTVSSRHSLTAAHQTAGHSDQAIALLKRDLTDSQRLLGSDHPDTLIARNKLAEVQREAGQADQAIALQERNLADSERLFGPDHPNTLAFRNNLALAHQGAGHLDQAIDLYQRNLADSERVLGPDHPDTLIYRNNLAAAHQGAGHLDRAIAIHERNLTDSERVLGPDHPATLTSRNNLAKALWEDGQRDAAREQITRAERDSAALNPEHEVRQKIVSNRAAMEQP